jgi:hypothetical protein
VIKIVEALPYKYNFKNDYSMVSLKTFLLVVFFCLALCQDNVKEFIEESVEKCDNNEEKQFGKVTLAYFTPWNKGGADLALKHAKKIDILSPCWFDFKPEMLNGKFNIKV